MAKKVTIAVCVPTTIQSWLKRKQQETGVSVSGLVSLYVASAKRAEEKAAEHPPAD